MSAHGDQNDRGEAGFTLVELLVTLTIIGLTVATVSVTIVSRDNTPSPAETARQMQSLIFRARSDAILNGRDTVFVVDVDERLYAYPRGSEPIALPGNMDIRMRAGGGFGTGDGETHLVFRPDGSSSGAEITLTDETAEAQVNVNWLTGVPRLIEGRAK